MKKILLSISCLALTTIASAQVQIPFPADVQFETFLKKEIPNIEKSTGVKLNGLKRNSTGKVIEFRYPETSGYNFKAWPKDGCQKEYFYIVPEQKSGIGGYVQINVNYRRSKCSGDDCSLTNKWEETSVLGEFSYNHTKAITKTEADSMAMKCVRYEKDSLLANFIKITKIEPSEGMLYNNVPSYCGKIISFNEIEFMAKVTGIDAVYTKDYSMLVSMRSEPIYLQLSFIMKFNGKEWVPVRRAEKETMKFEDSFFMDDKTINNPNPYYAPLCKSSINKIYNKFDESKFAGENILTKLQKRLKAIEDILLAKDENIKLEDLTPFLYKKEIKDLEVKTQEWIAKNSKDYSVTKYLNLKSTIIKYLENTEFRDENNHIVNGKYILKSESQSIFDAEVGAKKLKKAKEEYVNFDWIYSDGDWYITSVPRF